LVLGVDISQRLSAQVQALATQGTPVHWCAADARFLPIADDSVDRIRVDRVLQHIRAPQRAIAEMARVLRPGGTLVADEGLDQ
jgi:ubiquinone/menaquinone biosynthesis C-methylase UbiE